jgi:internalin A
MTDHANSTSRPRRTLLSFSVRGMIVLVLVIGVWLGWIVRSARIQRVAVTAIEKERGTVYYDWEFSNGDYSQEGNPAAPDWLINLIGADYFGLVTAVSLYSLSTETFDTVIVQVGNLTRLQTLNLEGSSISDAGLARLHGLTELSKLDLIRTRVTDAGLLHLKTMTSLTYLDLRNTEITDAGLAHLKGLSKLSELFVNSIAITDAGLANLRELTNLSHLSLNHTHAGAKRIRAMPNGIVSMIMIRCRKSHLQPAIAA